MSTGRGRRVRCPAAPAHQPRHHPHGVRAPVRQRREHRRRRWHRSKDVVGNLPCCARKAERLVSPAPSADAATCFWRLAGALRRAGPDPHSFSRGMPGGHGFATACVRKALPGEDGRGGCSMMDGAAHQRRRRAVAARPKHLRPLSCPRPWRRRTLGLDRPCGSDCRSRSERRSHHVRRAGCVVFAARQLSALSVATV